MNQNYRTPKVEEKNEMPKSNKRNETTIFLFVSEVTEEITNNFNIRLNPKPYNRNPKAKIKRKKNNSTE